MATPLLDTTASPPDTCPQQLRTASPSRPDDDSSVYPLRASPSTANVLDTESKAARIVGPIDTSGDAELGTLLAAGQSQESKEEGVGCGQQGLTNPSISVRYANNPFGTVLTTIVEQESHASLFPEKPSLLAQNEDGRFKAYRLPMHLQIEQGMDAVAMSECQGTGNGPTGFRHSCGEAKDLKRRMDNSAEGAVEVPKRFLEGKQVVFKGDSRTCLPEKRQSLPCAPKEPSPKCVVLRQSSTKSRPESVSPKHLFHIFPDFIQLGPLSQNDEEAIIHSDSFLESNSWPQANPVSTAAEREPLRTCSNESSNGSVGTSYLPAGLIPFPPAHASRRRMNSSSLSTRKNSCTTEPSSVRDSIETTRSTSSTRPLQRHQEDEDRTVLSQPSSPLPPAVRHEPPSVSRRVGGSSSQTSYESLPSKILVDSNESTMVNKRRLANDRSNAFTPTQEQKSRVAFASACLTSMERSPSILQRPSEAVPANFTPESSRHANHPSSRSRSSPQRRSGSSLHETHSIAETATPSTHTFRSAALESLLPIAAAEGIIIPYTLTPRHSRRVCPRRNPTTRYETSRSELRILYHRGGVCRHRAAAYAANGVEQQDTLLQMLDTVKVDGAVEIREKNDWCWRCRLAQKRKRVAAFAAPTRSCFFVDDQASNAERTRLVDV